MAMTGGKAYCVVDKTSTNGNRVRLYIYVKEKSQSTSTNSTVLQLGMYVNSEYDIGAWGKSSDSYIGTATSGSNCHIFNGAISKGSGTRWLIENKEVTVKHNTDGTKSVKIYWKWGINAYTSYIVGYQNPSGDETIKLTPIKSDCSAPTTFTATGVNGFDTSVKLSWSGAKSGIGNTISKYQIRYRKRATSTDDWGSWTDLTTISSTATSDSTTIDMSSKISRGRYVQFAIRTLGSAGSSYYSGWKYSSSLRRKYFTKCTAPTSFSLSSSPFDKNVTLNWSGASGGTNNNISSYKIQYNTSSNNSTWDGWNDLVSVSSTSASDNKTIDMSSKVSIGYYVKFRIRTQGSAGSDYYSGYKTSSAIKRISRCVNPTSLSATPNPFDSSVKISWSGAKGVTSNTINSYYIQYCTSTDNSTWGGWAGLKTVESTATSGNVTIDLSSKVDRGKYVKFRIRTQGSAGSTYYPTSYKELTTGIQRIAYTACTAPTTFNVSPNPFESLVKLTWSGANNGVSNNISSYKIQYRISPDNSAWGSWGASITVDSTLSNTNIDMSSITRGYYVQFRIQTCGSVSGYDSEYKTSSTVQRNLYSRCIAPTNIVLQSNGVFDTTQTFNYIFNDKINITWNVGQAGDNVNITSYYIQYQISNSANVWGSTWSNLTSSTTNSIQINPTFVQRGQYIRFRIQTRCNVSDYNSLYGNPTLPMKRVNLPPDISTITISPSEFTGGDNVDVSWEYCCNDNTTNYESPIFKYSAYVRYLDKNMNIISDWLNFSNQSLSGKFLNGNVISINLNSFLLCYAKIKNETYAEIAIIPYDAFGNAGSKNLNTCAKARVFRYDRSGVSIGINGRWIPCQIYYGVNGAWVQCDVSAGIENSWKQCSG